MKLKFTDGVEIDTSGPLRIVRKPDGLYVTGHGFLCPVDNIVEAEDLLAKLKENKR